MSKGPGEYGSAYNRGWRYSATSTASLDYADRRGWSRNDAWLDGYLDYAAGRQKWHLRDCPKHDSAENGGCGEA